MFVQLPPKPQDLRKSAEWNTTCFIYPHSTLRNVLHSDKHQFTSMQTKIKTHIHKTEYFLSVKTGYKRQNVDTWAIASLQNLDENENAARSEIPALPYIIMPQGPPQVTVTRHMTAESLKYMSQKRSLFRCGRYILRDL